MLRELTARARADLPGLASDEVLERVRDHNPSVFQMVIQKTEGRMIGFTAALPLTSRGLEAVLSGNFDPANPSLSHVAPVGAQVEAIYVWLIYGKNAFVSVVSALEDYVQALAPSGCSLFCRAATAESYRTMRAAGYEEACLSYPGAPEGLLVVHPESEDETEVQKAPVTRVTLARTLHEMMAVTAIRAATYMSEQECPFDEEFDGNDLCGAHLLGYIGPEPAGCIRVRFFDSFVKFERLAVRHEYRTSRLAFRLVRAAIEYAAAKGYTRVYGHARHDLVRFWQTFGFRPIPDRPLFSFSDVEYVEMEGAIKSAPFPVQIGDSPLRLVRPEGAWDTPGPLERAPDPARLKRVREQLRQKI
jgi:predicted GNAT family N-acyltransferase